MPRDTVRRDILYVAEPPVHHSDEIGEYWVYNGYVYYYDPTEIGGRERYLEELRKDQWRSVVGLLVIVTFLLYMILG